MVNSYTRKEIEGRLMRYKLTELYAKPELNYAGKTIDSVPELYREVVVDWLLDRKSGISNLERLVKSVIEKRCQEQRKKDYFTDHQYRFYPYSDDLLEDQLARVFVGQPMGCFGRVIDFQVPLKDTQKTDSTTGKIDLISKRDDELFVLELKRKSNLNDSFLHTLLEAFTYGLLIDNEKCHREFGVSRITACPMIFSDSRQMRELEESESIGTLVDQMGKYLPVKTLVLEENVPSLYSDLHVGRINKLKISCKRKRLSNKFPIFLVQARADR